MLPITATIWYFTGFLSWGFNIVGKFMFQKTPLMLFLITFLLVGTSRWTGNEICRLYVNNVNNSNNANNVYLILSSLSSRHESLSPPTLLPFMPCIHGWQEVVIKFNFLLQFLLSRLKAMNWNKLAIWSPCYTSIYMFMSRLLNEQIIAQYERMSLESVRNIL